MDLGFFMPCPWLDKCHLAIKGAPCHLAIVRVSPTPIAQAGAPGGVRTHPRLPERPTTASSPGATSRGD